MLVRNDRLRCRAGERFGMLPIPSIDGNPYPVPVADSVRMNRVSLREARMHRDNIRKNRAALVGAARAVLL
jgi:hypothetical protein